MFLSKILAEKHLIYVLVCFSENTFRKVFEVSVGNSLENTFRKLFEHTSTHTHTLILSLSLSFNQKYLNFF